MHYRFTLLDGLSRSAFILADYPADGDFTCVSNGNFNLSSCMTRISWYVHFHESLDAVSFFANLSNRIKYLLKMNRHNKICMVKYLTKELRTFGKDHPFSCVQNFFDATIAKSGGAWPN